MCVSNILWILPRAGRRHADAEPVPRTVPPSGGIQDPPSGKNFTERLLTQMYTEPARIEAVKMRATARKSASGSDTA